MIRECSKPGLSCAATAVQAIAPLFAVWQKLDLDSQQRCDLERILHNMPYLGRAESWVNAELASEHPEPNS